MLVIKKPQVLTHDSRLEAHPDVDPVQIKASVLVIKKAAGFNLRLLTGGATPQYGVLIFAVDRISLKDIVRRIPSPTK